jgi:predicted metal-binding membrane protein
VLITPCIPVERLAHRILRGAFTMGLEHGAYCVGCCWGVMLLLFAGGVMNLTVIAALTALVAFVLLAKANPAFRSN